MSARYPRRRTARPRTTQDRADGVVAHVVAVVAGLVVAAAGTLVHRWEWLGLPAGLALALVTVLVGAVFARAVAGGTGLFLYLLAGFLTAQLLTFVRPGGDVLVTDEAIGHVWLLAHPVAVLAALLAPRRWFAGPQERRTGVET